MTKKEDILKGITDEAQRKNIETLLNFVEATSAKSEMTADKFKEMFEAKAAELELDSTKVKGFKELAETVKRMEEKANEPENVFNFKSYLKKNQEAVKKAVESEGQKFTHKMVIPFSEFANKTAITTALVGSNVPGMVVPGVNLPAFNLPIMAQILGAMPIPTGSNHAIGYYDRTTSTRNADNIAENNTTTDSAAAWTYAYKAVEKIFDWIPFTKESVYDIDWMANEIRTFVTENLLLKEDYQLLHGTGTTPQIQGLYDIATAFDATDFAGKYKSGNICNLLLSVATKMSAGLNSKFAADTVILNPLDYISIVTNQDDFGRTDIPNFVTVGANSIQIGSMTVYQDNNITANTALVFDKRMVRRYANGIEIEIGYNAGDIIYDRQTMVGRIRESIVIPTNNLGGFYKVESISADIVEISAPAN